MSEVEDQLRQGYAIEDPNDLLNDVDAWDDTEILQVFDEAVREHKLRQKQSKSNNSKSKRNPESDGNISDEGTKLNSDNGLKNLLEKAEQRIQNEEGKYPTKGGVGLPGPWEPVLSSGSSVSDKQESHVHFSNIVDSGYHGDIHRDDHVHFSANIPTVSNHIISQSCTHEKAVEFDLSQHTRPPTPPVKHTHHHVSSSLSSSVSILSQEEREREKEKQSKSVGPTPTPTPFNTPRPGSWKTLDPHSQLHGSPSQSRCTPAGPLSSSLSLSLSPSPSSTHLPYTPVRGPAATAFHTLAASLPGSSCETTTENIERERDSGRESVCQGDALHLSSPPPPPPPPPPHQQRHAYSPVPLLSHTGRDRHPNALQHHPYHPHVMFNLPHDSSHTSTSIPTVDHTESQNKSIDYDEPYPNSTPVYEGRTEDALGTTQSWQEEEQAALSELLWSWYQSGYAAAKYQALVEINRKRYSNNN
eukprot:CAMPEP_0182423250 /NCGR_PEP_ID=MMETSP1167-20130531/9190_1 /TAXON_ID=2988 /ORGANISM="Mallomonas Sp, Strain CCMP3275" /LENGTH=471 /DNA_ID=CAMNT_0024602041 /DNA_START=87 /DNA_END=1502 /DNA_ORIENTATION=-